MSARPSPAPPPPPAFPPLSGMRLKLATVALGLGSFMNILDVSIANVSVPHIAGDLAVSPSQGTWVITSYAVSEAIMLPLTGWLSQRFGQLRMFLWATLLFTAASVLCGLSVNLPMLLFARVLQGVVGASMIPLTQTLLVGCYPPNKRGLALGLWSMTTVIAPIVGPVVGGWLTDHYSWHWVFLINLPFGIFVALVAASTLAGRESPRRTLPVDWVGLVLLIVGVGCLQILLDNGNELDWFDSPFIIALGIGALLALAVFVIQELTHEHPVVDLRLFANRNFLIGCLCLFVGMVAFFGTVVVLPLWLQSWHGYTALWAGEAIATGGVFAVLFGPIIGANLHRVDARAVASFGFFAFCAVALWSARFTPDVDFWTVSQTRLWMGIGISCFFLPVNVIAMSTIPPARYASASGLSGFIRNLGSSFGTALVAGGWDRFATIEHARLSEFVTATSTNTLEYLERLEALGLTAGAALAQIDRAIGVQAYLSATNQMISVSGYLMIALVPLIWLAARPKGPGGGGGH